MQRMTPLARQQTEMVSRMDKYDALDEFDYDDDGEESVIYYILGERPIIMHCIDSFPHKVEVYDKDEGKFVRDNSLIRRINDSLEIDKVDENGFKNFCLSRGIPF